ncbi:MAG: glutamine amidotransferase [Micrococcaceae bacterium]|jgi:CobQ-like glutamine amidotransferase family enzyme|uniref:Lipid II isoglutaminyl synthase (glutamine-hydrolyzing) subunit GatD n=1 Tax=Arthrobacter cheniae TaxID=1258888 RepID=A0A3A5M6C8_9MICC|nr:glutamine amidotransferase [Arthrobacter cheniae]MCU1634681.1 glutamine amidotransferase [Micrococcaceae bacterium]RJT79122.1 glutamine amidotransferase [Arthrobacter cheniae]
MTDAPSASALTEAPADPSKGTLRILQLYPREMNIYGDYGNVLVLKQRLAWRGYGAEILEHNAGDTFPEDVDLIVGGGGQDSGQVVIQDDLQAIAPRLRELAEEGTPMLLICGLYQLFGNEFRTHDGAVIPGIGVLDLETRGGTERLIGNVVATSEEFGEIHGYENHSGQTFLGDGLKPLATVVKGAGNNAEEGHEGARHRNIVASYLHGSLLPKNPAIADFLLRTAAERKFGSFQDEGVDDSLADLARKHAGARPR